MHILDHTQVVLFSFEATMRKIKDNAIKSSVLQVSVKNIMFFASTACKTVVPNLFSSVIFDSALLYLRFRTSANEDFPQQMQKM